MDRLWEYLEARMPKKGERAKTVSCKFAVGTARMIIENEACHTFDVNDINLWLIWLRKQHEGRIREKLLTADDPHYGIVAWLEQSGPNTAICGDSPQDGTVGGTNQED